MLKFWTAEFRAKYNAKVEKRRALDTERAKELYDTEADELEKTKLMSFVLFLQNKMNISESYARKLTKRLEYEYNLTFIKHAVVYKNARSEEHRRHLSEAMKGKTLSDEAKAKIGAATRARQLGRKYSANAEGKHYCKKCNDQPTLTIATTTPAKITVDIIV